ncbi:glucose 1-dehydrogenase [Lentilactobacillus otakiensis]|uniref:3-alpha-(Or 20-beta)-hydroxysteroid dehydrogenase n=1 Tax=Lentilactobacillus otakiensis DSM 19908 = JCM 15040 TaxID=1423780 RepID=S4NQD5_9LACO|nr:glucose 1-dehydrogenase [Lentilactobacillus otakiensis]KRL10339.1 3-alpha-(or 20-beta)-hydroxysteroid dehydrogenase [Lentilactobacillus otakiensis DSM 19908 = JCM 15040]MBZ3777007.1 glucose 1-dehydrogenase [Lentilactobacillus otakiensis]MDV3518031.1 glucose 1-dehydrogenase [Lentilactobacillus otakiensis]GAD16238.1 3-alpha-(or 20-beta)-hydroxysteroid dehydrogenase [Lentilactobacillus otakiensis DSM 19908 = JCM 15040]
MADLTNKVAIITGAASGLGKAFAKNFVDHGAKVIITDLNEENGKKVQQELGENSVFFKQDVSSVDDWKRVVSEGESKFGNINVLVNNAGIGIMKPIDEITPEEYDKVIKINQYSVFYGMKYVLPSMRKAGSGSIVNISSIGGLVAMPISIAYGASKYAVRGMTKDAALDLVGDHIRVNSVHPGVVQTPILNDIPDEQNEASLKEIPMGRFGKPEELANLVNFLASDEASYVTGQEFTADGGYTMK